ncbi:LOB domain-containing protein [Drosera capensis]
MAAKSVMSSSSSAPCSACKVQRRKCIPECIFAPYFPPDHPEKFIKVHKVFGASNVAKILNELPACHREDAVNSLAFEADARLKDPVYGCVGLISMLQHRLKQVKVDLDNARLELAHYIGPSAMVPMFPQGLIQQYNNIDIGSSSILLPYNTAAAMVGVPTGAVSQHGVGQPLLREPKMSPQLQVVNAQNLHVEGTQQLAAVAPMAVREEQEIMRTLEQQQQHHHHLLNQQQQQQQLIMKLNPGGGGYDQLGGGPVTMVAANGVGVGGGRFDQVGGSGGVTVGVSPSLALGAVAFGDHYQIHQQQQQETLMLLQRPLTPQQFHTEVALSAMYSQHDQKPEERSVSDDGAPLGGGSFAAAAQSLVSSSACLLIVTKQKNDECGKKKMTSDEIQKGRYNKCNQNLWGLRFLQYL